MLGLGLVSQIQELKAQEPLALNFNGTNSIIEFPAIRFDKYEKFTAEAWVYNWSGYLFSQGPFGDPENSIWMLPGIIITVPVGNLIKVNQTMNFQLACLNPENGFT